MPSNQKGYEQKNDQIQTPLNKAKDATSFTSPKFSHSNNNYALQKGNSLKGVNPNYSNTNI